MSRKYFQDLAIGCQFVLNGTRYVKQSSTTAKMLQYHNHVFYVAMKSLCKEIV